MQGIIKIKLPFTPDTTTEERIETLMMWSRSISRADDVTVIETQHFTRMSFIVIKNPRFRSNF